MLATIIILIFLPVTISATAGVVPTPGEGVGNTQPIHTRRYVGLVDEDKREVFQSIQVGLSLT